MGIDSHEPEPQGSVWRRLNRLLDQGRPLEGELRNAPYIFPAESGYTVYLVYRICRINERTIKIDSTIRTPEFGEERESVRLYEDETGAIHCGNFSTHDPEQITSRATAICCDAVGSEYPPCGG